LPTPCSCIEQIFGARSQALDNAQMRREVRHLRGQLEHLLGKREDWDMPLLRALFDALMQRARRRRRSPEHERLWFNLTGYCLRPGLGYALDEWRIEQLCPLLGQGVEYVGESQNWSEWWTLWRRAAGGLPAAIAGRSCSAELLPALQQRRGERLAAAWRRRWPAVTTICCASSPRSNDLPVEQQGRSRRMVARQTAQSLGEDRSAGGHSAASARVSRSTAAPTKWCRPKSPSRWLEALLAVDWKKVEPAAFAATQTRSPDRRPGARSARFRCGKGC
jgi:hypothetical protein